MELIESGIYLDSIIKIKEDENNFPNYVIYMRYSNSNIQ